MTFGMASGLPHNPDVVGCRCTHSVGPATELRYLVGPGRLAWESAHGNLFGEFIPAVCTAITSPAAVPKLPNVLPGGPCSPVLHNDFQLLKGQPRPSTQGTWEPQFTLPEPAQLKKPCSWLWASDLYVNLLKTGFVMHLTLETRGKKKILL